MNANSRPTRVIRRKRERPEPETFVFWDIVSCPVPNGHDARLVGPSIKSALNDGGYTHPITITAIGFLPYTENQTRTLYDLPELTATGINVIYVPKGYNEIMDYVRNWTWFHPRPATILFITGAVIHKYFYSSVSKLHDNGYTILHAYPGAKSTETKSVKSTFSWESIILQGV
ncbi:unnamed protein product [Microthlaspi erraticum]|uniref:NYN domain-containing protein n=1 Tax=Microthlaspi erraticum TaxID=1685480 RepID=A0A6D2JR40_9BRAS|nr:unnamed protein product [Microthlaspi erraticum]